MTLLFEHQPGAFLPTDVTLPHPPEAGWRRVDPVVPGQSLWVHPRRQLVAMVGYGRFGSEAWLHVSVRHKHGIPAWPDLAFTKASLLGDDRKAIVVLPERAHWVNLHPHVLHLWSRTDGDDLPEFGEGGTI